MAGGGGGGSNSGGGESSCVSVTVVALTDKDDLWCTIVKCVRARKVTNMDWESFLKLFLDKYLPKIVKEQMEIDFMQLTQVNHTITEYDTTFG
ncbi:hypothetical protein RJ639_043825 [Escallonia herrerae]|uniref:Retrotransposon gag domain-containing protein n=1 Tax=Escallonia herrerae TaxID=1293975 RepID=A0AA88WIN3_9ASTE|nr:hypothetical protein RJ639_043825 [Escallonia herrerae]